MIRQPTASQLVVRGRGDWISRRGVSDSLNRLSPVESKVEEVDSRTPEELLGIIEQKGAEIQVALTMLRKLQLSL